jgi:uncharacterized Zn finger protein
MATRPIETAAVRALAAPESFSRGRRYFRDGAVGEIVRRGAEVSAAVEGSEIDPYNVTVRLSGSGVADARCTCPYDWGGYCKHIVAVLLKLAEHSEQVVERPTIADLLAALDKEQLVALIARRLDVDGSLASWIEAELATTPDQVSSNDKCPVIRRMPVDQTPIREQAQALLRGRYRPRRHWDDFHLSGTEDELQQLVQKAAPFIKSGDGCNALRVLEPIAETLVKGWIEAGAADERVQGLFYDLGRMIAEAALMSTLALNERDDLAERVERWHRQLSDYGLDDCMAVAARALETGWEEPELRAVLVGEARHWPASGHVDSLDTELTNIRLHVLSASNRSEEYLRLAQASGAHTEYASMLVKLGRVADAMAYARKRFKAPSEAHELAKVLREAGKDPNALEVGEIGLALRGNLPGKLQSSPFRAPDARPHGLAGLAHWLRDYAGAVGKVNLALKAATVAFEETHSLEDFRSAETWAKASGSGKSWPKIRQALFANLGNAKHAHDRTLIYLEEGLIDDAVRSAGEASDNFSDTETLMRLADAAAASHPDWVIRFAVAKAASIMDNNRAGHYAEAARWLEKAALAYEAAGREDDWVRLLDALIDKHRRKYKLKPLLEALR